MKNYSMQQSWVIAHKKTARDFQEVFLAGCNLQYLSIFCPMTVKLSCQSLREKVKGQSPALLIVK
jgi:hypothetical protein